MLTPRTFDRIFGTVVTNKPTRKSRQSLLDVPTYTIPEAAASLAISSRTLHYWFAGKNRIFNPSAYVGDYALLSFRDVSEAYVLYALRAIHGFSFAQIRHDLRELAKETKSKHPLLQRLSVFGKRHLIYEKPARTNGEREIIDLSRNRNLAMGPVIDVFGKRILRNEHGQTVQLFPWRYWSKDNESRPVALNPDVMSGRLVVTGTRIPVSVLVALQMSGKKPAEIADNYGLNPEVVKKALLHIERPVQKVA
jgi:uncharacterized protein (DUF433 family)/DNA-binding transcriptional MerR regulator